MSSTMSRRQFFINSGKAAFAASLASVAASQFLEACGTGSGSGNATVTFWHSYNTTDPENSTLLNKVIPAFNKKYPNIAIKSQDIPYQSLLQKITASVAGGNGPDVIRSDIIWMPQLAKIQALASLDDVVAQRKEEFYAGSLATCYYKGHYYGLPLDTNTKIIIYNKSLFTRAGITSVPQTTDDFHAAAQKITALGGSIFGYAEGGLDAWNILPWIWTFGGAVTDDNYTTATGYINGPQSVAAVQYLLDMLDSKALSPGILGGSSLGTTDALGKNLAGMVIDGPWVPPTLQGQYASTQFAFGGMPTGPGGSVQVVGGEDIAILSTTKNLDAAKTWVSFMTSDEAQRLMGGVGQMPVLKSASSDPSYPDYYSFYSQQLETAKPRPVTPNYEKIDTALTDAWTKALQKKSSVQAALDEAASTINTLL